jgi:uncharacterized protein YdiU (UPF0061 family)
VTVHFPFDNSYSRLPPRFYARVAPTPVAAPRVIRVNRGLAEALGLDPAWLESPAGAEILSGQRVPEAAEPIALAYAGHQFGNFVPQLGDGRAVLLGEVVGRDGVRRDIQLKGAGRTPFSCCANTLSAKPCMRLAFPPPAHWQRWRPVSRCCARDRCPAPC